MSDEARENKIVKDQQRYFSENQLGEVVLSVLKIRRRAIVYDLGRRIYSQLKIKTSSFNLDTGQTDGWIQVVSLSQLRSIVGGRFQNLKDRWIDAGFPLRAHRGDRKDQALVNLEGWSELANWIGKQGFEALLAAEGDSFLFSIRSLSDAKSNSE